MGFDYAGKVRALLATATSMRESGNDEGADTFEAKAQEWMRRYKIAEENALAEDPTTVEPITLRFHASIKITPVSNELFSVIREIAKHTEVRYRIRYADVDGYDVDVVGYEGDVRYFEMLWTSAFLMFTTRITPHWDKSRSDEENIFFLRHAGIQRREIADLAWGLGAGALAKNRSKIQRVYLAESARRGETPAATGLGFQTEHYREAYAQAFVMQLSRRLRRARDAANTSGGVVVLAGRYERVEEAFYALFPGMRPTPREDLAPYVAPNANCARCAKAKSGFCTEHGYLKPSTWSAADQARWEAKTNGASARAGRVVGRDAADGVALRGTASPTAQRVEGANRALEG